MGGMAYVPLVTYLASLNSPSKHIGFPLFPQRKKSFVFSCLMSDDFEYPSHFVQEKELKRLKKAENRINHIANLLSKKDRISLSDKKALDNLLSRDTYDPTLFTESHRQFKRIHNDVFILLALHCSSGVSNRPVFYLDGSDGGTTSYLRKAGWSNGNLYIANLFQDTAKALKDSHGVTNVFVGRAEDVLASTALGHVPFVAYYLDGCGGSSAPLIAMLEAIFCDARMPRSPEPPPAAFAVGITLTESDSIGGRSLADREQDVTRRLAQLARARRLRMDYAGDDPARFGLSESPRKRDGIAQTTWIVLSP
jgi:hypothetical protein